MAVNPDDPLQAEYDALFERFEDAGYEVDAVASEDRAPLLVHLFVAEVLNGGLFQFLDNPYGDYAYETLEALRELDFKEGASALEAAFDRLPEPLPSEIDERQALLEKHKKSLREAFRPLEEPLYEMFQADRLDPIRPWLQRKLNR